MKRSLIFLVLSFLLSSCGLQWQYTTLNHVAQVDGIYRTSDIKVDTIDNIVDLDRKLRTDFNFRWDFAQYAMNQPYSWYWNNPRLDGIWRPYNRFDVYFYSNWFWSDWAFNYPFHHTWGWNNWYSWNRPYYYYGWNRPYRPWNSWYQGPWNNPGYNVVWNSSRRRNYSFVNGYRSNIVYNNIQTSTSNRRTRNTLNRTNYIKPVIVNNNDQTTRSNTRTRSIQTQSSSNGWWSRSRQVIPNETTRLNQPSYVQPRQIRGGSSPSISQQPSSSQRSSGQGRRGGGRER